MLDPSPPLLADAVVSSLVWGSIVAGLIVSIALAEAGAKLRKMRKARERTLREISAYIIEGSIDAASGERIVRALGSSAPAFRSWLTVFRLDPKSWLAREETYRVMVANVAEGKLGAEEAAPVLAAMAADVHEDVRPA